MEIGLIVKVSKLCNLRCVYCYEYPELANQQRMSVGEIATLFVRLRNHFAASVEPRNRHRLHFIWHGGEPFAQPISYWKEILVQQKRIFKGRLPRGVIRNSVQSNLLLLTQNHLPLLRREFELGFSYDVVNDYRVDAAGKSSGERVRKKVDWLLQNRIPLSGIAVVSRANVDQPQQIAEYFLERGLGFRALNLYESLDTLPQIQASAVPLEAYVGFLKKLYSLSIVRKALREGCWIDPFREAMKIRSAWRAKKVCRLSESELAAKDWYLGINTNGDTYGPGDMYHPTYRYGNVFRQSLAELLSSEGRKRRIARSLSRLQTVCSRCPFFRRGCAGIFVSHATEEDYERFVSLGGCYERVAAEMIHES